MQLASFKLYCSFFFLTLFSTQTMAQSDRIILDNRILLTSENTKEAALILNKYLDQISPEPFVIESENNKKNALSKIVLQISKPEEGTPNAFTIESDETNIYLIASDEKFLKYAVYTLLENWGFRKWTASDSYFPKIKQLTFLKNTKKRHEPSFEYRALLYPDAYEDAFRDWHKLDWHLNDFGIWGHSFDALVPPKEYFQMNPLWFALYEGKRRSESLCMTNDTVRELVTQKMKSIISNTPDAQFYSLSQNDDVIYCECEQCKVLNEKNGGPQGSLYFFLNQIAARFPETKITTLAYLHTYEPPLQLTIASNIYTLFCPIELNRGNAIKNDSRNDHFIKTLQNWSTKASHLYIWDYTVQFSNYLSPFPNFHTFFDNYKLFKENNVKGVFVQGSADIPGDFSELRQYLLAKLVWDSETDIEATTDDFLRGFYGKAAPAIKKYLALLTQNQQKNNAFLDIYSGPVQRRADFLSPEAMNQYDQYITNAEMAVKEEPVIRKRILKLRMALEYVYFEQSKFYGKDPHGMFVKNEKGGYNIRKGLTERVRQFADNCIEFGIYELSEAGVSPNEYYKQWLEITKNSTTHLGENLKINFITPPENEFSGKGSYGLVDGIRGHNDFNMNWIGWYGTNPEIEIHTEKLKFNTLQINFLEDQRHWIFPPEKIRIYGLKNQQWQYITEYKMNNLTDNYTINTHSCEIINKTFSRFTKLKIVIQNHQQLPEWRKRKFKKPMVMMDEIELNKK